MATICWENNREGLFFRCLGEEGMLPVSAWGKHKVVTALGEVGSIGALLLSLECEEGLQPDDFQIFLPHSVTARLESHQIRQIGLPTVNPFRLHISGEGIITRPSFRFVYHFAQPDGRPVMGLRREGVLVAVGENRYTLQDPIFSLVEKMDAFNRIPVEDMDARFLVWGEMKEILPEEVVVEDYLQSINVAPASAFTLDIKRSRDSWFDPILVREEFETIDAAMPGQLRKVFKTILPEGPQEIFARQFWEAQEARGRYALGGGWFVAIPPALHKALAVVHGIHEKTVEERRAFVANPRRYLADALAQDVAEEVLEELFYESPEYLSERVKCLGRWQPKAGVYLYDSGQDWLGGPEEFGIPIQGSLFRVAIDDLPQLIEQIRGAREKGEPYFDYKGQKIPTTKEAEDVLGLNMPELKPDNESEQETEEEKKQRIEKLVPLIKDNLEIEEFRVEEHPRKGNCGTIPGGLKSSLMPHQKEGVFWLQDHWQKGSSGCLLADDMGLGKTFQALVFLAWLREQMLAGHCRRQPLLLVAPTGLLKNWEEEEEKHLHRPGLGSVLRAYGASFRAIRDLSELKAAHEIEEYDWVLTTYETLRDYVLIFTRVEWGAVVFDEAQKIKNPRAMMTDMAKSLKADFTLALTGTPVENRLGDLWCIVDTVQPGRLGDLKGFSRHYECNDQGLQIERSAQLKEMLLEEKPAIMLRRLKEDHIQGLPAKIPHIVERQMPPKQASAYQHVLLQARAASGEPGVVLQALQNLRSISLHPYSPPIEAIGDEYIEDSARLAATIAILDKVCAKGEKALIFVESLEMQQCLVPYLQQRYKLSDPPMVINGAVSGPKRQERVRHFQGPYRDQFDVMILSPKAGGVGLTLTAANHVVHLSRWWNPAVEDQCTDRVFRIGQEKDVNVYFPLAVHPELDRQSFDLNLNNLLERKRTLSREVLAPPVGSLEDAESLFNDSVKSYVENRSGGVTIQMIDLMEPLAFEDFILRKLSKNGYEVRRTPASGDGGADGIAIAKAGSDRKNLIIQCKHSQTNSHCGESAVREILESLNRYRDLTGPLQLAVVTNAKGFSSSAKALAMANEVILVDRYNLLLWLSSY